MSPHRQRRQAAPTMPIHRVVVTSGTSALTGSNQFVDWARQTGLVVSEGTSARCALADESEALSRWRERLGQLPDVPRAALASVSAECAVVAALLERKQLVDEPDVAIVCSDTFAGEAAALLVQRVLETTLGARVRLHRTADLDAEDHRAFVRSLGRLMADVLGALRAGVPSSTCFGPIGGYKVMTALGYVAGSVGGYSTAYVHERTKVLHFVPAIPVQLDPEVARAHGTLFRRLARGPVELHALDAEERRVVEAHPFFFERADDLVELGAFGVFALEQVEPSALQTRVLATPEVAAALGRPDAGPFFAKELRNLTERLKDPGRFRAILHHEADFGVRDATAALYKGASGSAGVFRAVYRYRSEDDRLHVFFVWDDHHAYERDAVRRVSFPWDEGAAVTDVTTQVFA